MSLLALQHGLRDWLVDESGAVAARCAGSAGAGLSVYLNNYRGQLIACLRESYGTTQAWLGDAAFDGAAAWHIDRVPPCSWTLDDYALGLPDTLETLYPDDPEVGELARLERALAAAFVAEDHRPIDPAGLSDVDWEHAVICFAPGVSVLSAATNASAIWSAIAHGETPAPAQALEPAGATLVWRKGFTPGYRTLDPMEARALSIARDGESFGALCASLVEQQGEIEGPAMAGACLARWMADEIIVDIAPRDTRIS